MINQALAFILQNVINLFLIALLLRVYMQWVRVPFKNPFSQFIVKFTDFAVKPVRRIVPGLFGLDMGTLLLAISLQLLLTFALGWLSGFPFAVVGASVLLGFGLLALVSLLSLMCYVLMGLVAVVAVLSLVNPYSPYMVVFDSLTRPVLGIFRRWIPLVGNVDLSPVAFFLVMQFLVAFPLAWLAMLARQLM
ncbi:YggT family protein [Sulfuriferula nivalis]|uniref:Membrane protein n=1 Tax=Sulfuriferula nivalis TaxID=2675298 RepID=A0A809S4H5_9PROT|nr:YggT family protein [Sulfuriferula nivalis]BBP01878.1 membrane protein [Sulfuriferula nivalis]